MIGVTMSERLNVVWADVAGKMNDISRDQLPAYLALCVDDLGSDIVVVDLRPVSGQPDAMALMAQRLAFPDYFGGNLDALFDVVSERVAVDVASQKDFETIIKYDFNPKAENANQVVLRLFNAMVKMPEYQLI